MKKLLLTAILPLMISCTKKEQIDLAKSSLNEPVKNVISYDNDLFIGVQTVEYPFSLLLEVENSANYTFDGIDLKGQRVIFQIGSEKLKTDSITRFGGGHVDLKPIKNENDLNAALKSYGAESKIYGVRIEMTTPELKAEILKKIEAKYGKGTKNPNTDNGLYWNIKKENKYIFFAPDYKRLIIVNNSNLSKTCYWDIMNGMIDFGGCDNEKYMAELVKNSTKPEDVKGKPVIKIDKNWNINGLVLGKTNEEELVKSATNKSFERMSEFDGSTGNVSQIIYQDNYHDFYFYLSANKANPENQKGNLINGYAINDFRKVAITFENGLKVGQKFADIVKSLDKTSIKNYDDLKFSNYIEIKNQTYTVTLNFDENMLLSGMYVK
ncbi:hypothetical protein [Pedobacter xixiisoli]|uniref:Uncharacterized protein n=1 Tax=Pedobacter xixiisoli TaxID=1476464 RepID=A0A286A8V2_9SPHI|nr:hypothetical protein [Pedobacter xixiisoli]SOD18340.1 hypothetical protein SAMN06297358_2950 [Pedobacter xixiisoli]